MEFTYNKSLNNMKYITEEDVKQIVSYCGLEHGDIEDYTLCNASDKMLGFLSDYWRLTVYISMQNNVKESISFFIKAISKSNAAKANMVKELNLFNKELYFYSNIKNKLNVPGMKSWSPRLVIDLTDSMVFEDLNALHYKTRSKLEKFDMSHTLQALRTLARFHGASIIFEEKRSKELKKFYCINDEYEDFLDEGGYRDLNPWFIQCRDGALEALKIFSNYSVNKDVLNIIVNSWSNVWSSALELSNRSLEHRNVICHRDLWNNNILFHYSNDNPLVPDDCVLVDFQAIRYQPPAGDVMLLLHCNLDPKFRETHMEMFLNYYYQELAAVLNKYGISIEKIIPKHKFLLSAEQQRKWALIVCACLLPQFSLDDDVLTKYFYDSTQFNEILSKDKVSFIKKMMLENEEYRNKNIEIFEEIVNRFCIKRN